MNVTNKNYKQEVEQSAIPVLLEFWAPWCGQCIMMRSMMENINKEHSSKIKLCLVNADDSDATALVKKFSVTKLPTFVLLEKGKEISRSTGTATKTNILNSFYNHGNK